MGVSLCALILAGGLAAAATTQPATESSSDGTAAESQTLSIRLLPSAPAVAASAPQGFTARFTRDELKALLTTQPRVLPLPFQFPGQLEAYLEAVDQVGMGALVERMTPYLTKEFGEGFDPVRDVIAHPVPPEERIQLQVPDLAPPVYEGPVQEVLGFLVHDLDEESFIKIGIRAVQAARLLLDKGDPASDRRSVLHKHALAEAEIARVRAAQQQAAAAAGARERQAAEAAAAREAARQRVGQALGIYDAARNVYEGTPNWAKESRRFSYVVREGQFIDRLKPLVDHINQELALAGFPPPGPTELPGIHFDADLRDVEILLPLPMLEGFLAQADRIEQRMAEDHIISIEAVRLTDRDIVNGAIASRLSVLSQGVHDTRRGAATDRAVRQFTVNSLLAVANRQLALANLRGLEGGVLPAGSPALQLPALTLGPAGTDRTATTVGGDFSVGADDIFFDGRQQSYGFSYIGPDGLAHTLALDVVDSLREFWERIERNLIVHKIKKTEVPSDFTVPVGPAGRTYKGIAALISQQNQEIVVTGDSGVVVRLSATAGTWLIIQDFDIEPIPGSSTDLTQGERRLIQARVLLTMLLRDPRVSNEVKARLVEAATLDDLEAEAHAVYEGYRMLPIRPAPLAAAYEEVYDRRAGGALDDAAVEKKERNSRIKLSFYSSQGGILRVPGTTELGDANDLTSFTTELQPNIVTPISSFFTKAASGAEGTSPLTGVRKGESSEEEKTMTHLVIRVRFPTAERERQDRDEGRHLGYFTLPLGRRPHSMVDLPFLSSSEHPLERLAKLRVGLMFDALQRDRVKKPFELINPNSLLGTISLDVYETATTRLMMNRTIINNSPASRQALATRYRSRFMVEVRTLLEYDEEFFDSPNMALRNMAQWNDPDRILVALHNSPSQFALRRLVEMIDELGEELVPLDFAEQFLAVAPWRLFGGHRLRSLSDEELRTLRRDVANHYLRVQETYGDAFMEAISQLLSLGSYRASAYAQLLAGPLRGYHDLVVFDYTAAKATNLELFERTYDLFSLLKRGGYKGGLFESSLEAIQDLDPEVQRYIIRGRRILTHTDWWDFFDG